MNRHWIGFDQEFQVSEVTTLGTNIATAQP